MPSRAGTVHVDPAPAGEELSKAFIMEVEGKPVPVYLARVAPRDPQRRWKAMDDKANSADYFETAAFGYFDLQGVVTVKVTCPEVITSAKVLPSSFGIAPVVEGKSFSFSLAGPKPFDHRGKRRLGRVVTPFCQSPGNQRCPRPAIRT